MTPSVLPAVGSIRHQPTGSGRAIVTVVTFKVRRTLKGELGAQTQLAFLGGTVGECRMDLARQAVRTSVDAEGDVVWIQEYLRDRLNGCTHAQSLDRVTQHIDGQGVPPVCK